MIDLWPDIRLRRADSLSRIRIVSAEEEGKVVD